MATWITHLRVAEATSGYIPGIDFLQYVTGNVSPDCGYGEKDSLGDFTPPPAVTHWTKSGRKADIDARSFFEKYIEGKPINKAFSFYLGYYVHLLTDIKWGREIYMPTRLDYKEEYEKNPDFLRIIKKDWYGIDHQYLRDHPGFKAFKEFAKKEEVADYLPYYEKGQLTKQTRFIADFYLNFDGDIPKSYRYLTEARVERFVNEMSEEIRANFASIFP